MNKAEEIVKDHEEFRDSLATVTADGKRNWIFAKQPKGKYYTARTIVSWILLLFLFIAPFVKVNGHQFMMLNFLEREFILFGVPFGPHDFHLFVLAMIFIIVSIFLFTVVYGRLFCGWICPQTIFMEMVFRKIEYWIEGDPKKQAKLKNSPMTGEKFLKKFSKNAIFFAISFLISNMFLAFIIGGDELIKIVTDPPGEHISGLAAITLFSGVFYFIFSSFREQVCTLVCPYGRLQGVMLDSNSIVIAYDYKRGEPRGVKKKGDEKELGDCIDCHRCVDVCPTGIDIRNGTQLECVNCTACIDECDQVMDKLNRPLGLIRYASQNEIETRKRNYLTPRAIGYTIVLFVLLSVMGFLAVNRTEVEATILRTPGLLSQEQPGNKISNLYDVKIINKTFNELPARLELISGVDGEIQLLGDHLHVGPQEVAQMKFMVLTDKDNVKQLSTPIEIAVKSGDNLIDIIKTTFIAKTNRKESTE